MTKTEPKAREHPRKAEILAHAKAMPYAKRDRGPLLNKVNSLLLFYSETGDIFPPHNYKGGMLYHWISGTLFHIGRGSVSTDMQQLFKLFGFTWETEQAKRPAEVPKGPGMRLSAENTQKLLALRPEVTSVPDEPERELAESIWWYWFRRWLDHELHHPNSARSASLQVFVDMQDDLIEDGGLGKHQREMLDVIRDEKARR